MDNSHQDDLEGEREAWAMFDESFRQVQSFLDRNRVLIQEVNDNQQSRLPENMVKNVALIQEINGNISKVVSLYSDLNSNFSDIFKSDPKKGRVADTETVDDDDDDD